MTQARRTPVIDAADIGRVAQNRINASAAALLDKLGDTLSWRDRHLGFSEWLHLTEAIESAEIEATKTTGGAA